ncbi:hypothetical protein IQ244_27375 [Nostoc sp. LEGE 06077]|uniref:hypothetical protein n=1 Tax=Nostoc sp. LEGE 06077 TaxID=915325 RepID=UPI001882612E|nr:hypothetical protein [Nostoc sp. LEGE 06077]MBE9210151.1 hypothetical protein [Nostoc sp. LEGE 06077]
MTQAKMSSSPRFVDFGYEPGTLVLGGIWLNTKIFDLCVHRSRVGEGLGRGSFNSYNFLNQNE